MSETGVVILGAIAGFTIFLGLPVGRMKVRAVGTQVLLAATAIGILLFLLWDVLTAGVEPVEHALETAAERETSWGSFAGLSMLLVAGLAAGLVGLAAYEQWVGRRRRSFGPGAAAVAEFTPSRSLIATPGQRIALLIAVGIGVHNFAEGLAIGQSAASGATSLALLLVIGFALHNATEGFGIVAPTAGETARPSWRLLALLGLIGGGPTFLGTLVGQAFVSDALTVAFLAVAAGSILYVVLQLAGVTSRAARPVLLTSGIVLGFVLGLGTDLILEVAGG